MRRKRLSLRNKSLASLLLVFLFFVSTLSSAAPATPLQAQGELPWRDKSSPFGVVAALGNRVRAEDTEAAVLLLKEAGVQWQREEIFWDRVQQTPDGPFNWTGDGSGFYNYDRAIEAQVRAGINVLGLLDYNPAWFKGKNPRPEEWINDWGNFVYNAVARYGRDRGWIKYWELWNEPNLAKSGYESGLYEVKDFVRILEVGRAAALAADPEAKIVMGGLASIWGMPPSEHNYDYFEYLLGVAEAGGWDQVDILAIHLYRPDSPEGAVGGRHRAMDLRTELDHLDEFLRKYGAKPIWITEMGWSTHAVWPGVDGDTQAFYLVRTYILAIAHGSVEKLFWYDFRDDTDPAGMYEYPAYDPNNEQYHFGLLRRMYPLNPHHPEVRKPSFVAYRTMTSMLAGLSLRQVIADGNELQMPGIYWYRFANNERRVDVFWRTIENAPEIDIDCECEEAMVRSWNGTMKQLLYTDDGSIRLRLHEVGAPVYVEYDPPPAHTEPFEGGIYFGATGRSVHGGFLAFWQANGGMERFGNPLTDELVEPQAGTGRPSAVQYFERARFEYFPELQGTPRVVQIGNPGHAVLQQQGINWHMLPKATNVPTTSLMFEETGHSVASPFREVWERYGLALMGYPLSEPIDKFESTTERPYQVQYFERARLEYFPPHQDQPAMMRFGLLGRELYTNWHTMP